MKIVSGEDRLNIVYEGPPRTIGGEVVPGDRFHLAGDRARQAQEGVELARGMSGLFAPALDYRYDTSANQPGSTFVSAVANRREISCSINVFGDTQTDFRRNWRRWLDNNPPEKEGKLWFITSDAPERFSFVRPSTSAGISSVDFDPNILRKLENFEWGWQSDFPYMFGIMQQVDFDSSGVAVIDNPSDVGRVYPKLYLAGPGQFRFGTLVTPTLAANEVIRLNFDPAAETYVKRNTTTGQVTNLWYTLIGRRPSLHLVPGINQVQITMPTDGSAYIEYTPLFKGAM